MNRKFIALPLLICCTGLLLCAGATITRAQDVFPVDELQPGMLATARTVYQGNTLDEFQVKIIDVMRNFYPKRDLIIVRLVGEKAEFYGPVAGMSGSPVYYDGKLIGALSYSLGAFLREPLMGVTPFDEMLEIFDKELQRETEVATVPRHGRMQQFLEVAVGLAPPTWDTFAPPALVSAPAGGELRRLPIPLQMSGFSENGFAVAKKYLAPLGFRPVRGGSAGAGEDGGELVPGAPVAAVLMHGDYDIAATGTVTYRNKDKVLAFGHPFFDSGPVALPMAQAKILTTISSDLGSEKMGLTGKIVGTLVQDRTTGVMGTIGPVPEMTQIAMAYNSEAGQQSQFAFSLAQDRSVASLAPLILRVALISALESGRLGRGENTLALQGTALLDDGTEIKLDNLFPGYQPLATFSFLNSILHSTGQVAATLAAIVNNPYRYVKIKKVDLNFKSIQGRLSATLENVWLSKTAFQPGDSIRVRYRLRPFHGKPFTGATTVVIPPYIESRSLTIVVGSASSVSAYEKRRMPAKFAASSYPRLIDLLRNARKNNWLVVQVWQADRGVIVDGEELPALPPSLQPVLSSAGTKNKTFTTRDRVIFESQVEQDFMVQDIRLLRISRGY